MRFSSIRAKIIPDSRGNETIEVSVFSADKAVFSASVPQGASKGKREAVYLPARLACENIGGEIASVLCGREWNSAEDIDRALIALDGTENKSRLGANALLAVSVAASRAEAGEAGVPLWKHVQKRAGKKNTSFPFLFINMIEGGLHSKSGLAIQEFLVILNTRFQKKAQERGRYFYGALGKELEARFGKELAPLGDEGGYAPALSSEEEPFQIFDAVRKTLGVENDFEYGYDAAASNISFTNEKLFALHETLVKRFPISFIEDPFGEEAFDWFAKLRCAVGGSVIVAGDDLTVTNLARIREANARGSINGVIVKPNQIGTLTETIEAARLAESFGWKVIVSHRSGETNDDWIADVSVGIGAYGMKLGAPSRPERLAKYERLAAIELECSSGDF